MEIEKKTVRGESFLRILKEFHLHIDKEMVFRQIHCYPESPVYEEMEEAFENLLEPMKKLCNPVGVMSRGKIPSKFAVNGKETEREAIFVLVTVGQEISDTSTEAFTQGDYVKGMLADAMADAALFSLEEDIQRELKAACGEWHLGVLKRLEAPQDISMEIQKEVLEQTQGETLLGLTLSQGYMFRPLKTSSQIYLTTEEEGVFQAQHNCRTCPNLTCGLRRVEPLQIRMFTEEKEEVEEIIYQEGSLLEALRNQTEGIPAFCGGKGLCGKCKIQVVEGWLSITEEDRRFFGEEELKQGWRLACRAYPKENLTIRAGWKNESQMEVLSGYYKAGEEQKKSQKPAGEEKGFAIDIGTTTVAVELVDLTTGQVEDTCTALNGQRIYGADVIARIQASMDGKGSQMKEKIRQELWKCMESLLQKRNLSWGQIEKITVAANTTMIHLLMGYPCDGLGSVPFTPYHIQEIKMKGKEIFPGLEEKTVLEIYPGISAFVGADIVSGMCALSMGQGEEICLLIDLGTNGEMALGNEKKLLVTSTAAGPAFEGGNIIWGTGSVPGAICHAKWTDKKLEITTIQGEAPVGICGTGVIELVAELVKAMEVDETGRLEEPWFSKGYPVAHTKEGKEIRLFQKDIREIQLAKAAVRAGIETLLEEYRITAKDVGKVYVAGGFGYRLDYEKAVEIGMFPEEFRGKIQAVGNSSLQGAKELLVKGRCEAAAVLAKKAEEVELSVHPVFQQAYMDAMFFE
ncbi:MAG: ASKHA domain-containing protein [Oliverpabstia sp.]|nr:ASKHA domain-containing protein [Oliverpabstia sp.]